MWRFWLSGWILVSRVFAQTGEPDLHGNDTALVKLQGGVDRSWRISLPEGRTAQLDVVERQGLAGVVSVLGPDGSELVEADLRERAPAAKNLLIPPGAAQIRMQAYDHGSLERAFEFRIGELRALNPQGRVRIQAEQLLGQGERLTREQKEGYVDRALATQEKALALWKQLSDTPHQATVLVHLATIRAAKRDLKPALEDCQRALDLWSAEHDRSGMEQALNEIADVSLMQEQLKKAGESIAEAIELARASDDTRNLAQALMIQGDVHERRGEGDQARANYAEALQLVRQEGDRLSEVDDLMYLTTSQHNAGRLREATDTGVRALTIAKEEGDQVRMAFCLLRLSNVYASMGDFRKAISYGEEALPILWNPAAPFKYGNALYNVAAYHEHVDDYQTALKDFTEALSIFRSTGSVLGQAFALSGLASVHLRLGDEDKADEYYRETSAQFHKASNKQGEVLALLALGGIALRHHQFDKAIELQQQALTIASAAGFQQPRETALGDLSESYYRARDFRASAERAGEKLDLIHKTGNDEQEQEANALRQQGRAWRSLHEYDRGQEVLDKALKLYQSEGILTGAADTLYELAALDRDRGRLEGANTRIATALDSLEAAGAGAGSAETRMLFAASHRKSYDLAIDVAMRLHDSAKAFELSERARARTLVDMIRGARLDIREGADPALLDRERSIQESLNEKQERLAGLLASSRNAGAIAPAKSEIADLLEKYQTLEAEIRTTSPRYAALVQPRALSLEGVQGLLDPQTALIEFWLGEEHSYGWLITRTDCRGIELPPAQEIEALARRGYAALTARNLIRDETPEQTQARASASDREFVQISSQLSRMLLTPMKGLSSSRRLWVVSDGALEYLPFAALPAPGSTVPLVATHRIALLPSATVLAEVRQELAQRQPAPRYVAVFGDPVFRADDERVTAGRATVSASVPRAAEDVDLASLPRLWFSRREADAVAAFAPRGSSHEVLDFDASRTEVMKPALADYRVIHFATHAFLDSRNPELSGLVLSMVDRSGQLQDGFLRLHEIYNLKLNADLVVLSGCQTALGQEVQSEGLVGLTRGFMYAGAPQIMASLWGVRDRATSEFMSHFYQTFLGRNLAPDAALRSAQLAMMKDPRWSQPYYWAAFTMQGAR
jgi:CHAT domain-containing protein